MSMNIQTVIKNNGLRRIFAGNTVNNYHWWAKLLFYCSRKIEEIIEGNTVPISI